MHPLIDASLAWLHANLPPDREDGLVLSVKGYPEFEPIVLPASGNEVVFRMRAVRPGAGFPIVANGADAPLGMLKVAGPHTVDEGCEEMR